MIFMWLRGTLSVGALSFRLVPRRNYITSRYEVFYVHASMHGTLIVWLTLLSVEEAPEESMLPCLGSGSSCGSGIGGCA